MSQAQHRKDLMVGVFPSFLKYSGVGISVAWARGHLLFSGFSCCFFGFQDNIIRIKKMGGRRGQWRLTG